MWLILLTYTGLKLVNFTKDFTYRVSTNITFYEYNTKKKLSYLWSGMNKRLFNPFRKVY